MANLSITNVVNISVATAQTGVGAYNTSNLALFSDEPFVGSFGSLGYQIYLSPQQVAVDFGTSSKTYQMAVAVFSQQPNILSGGGYLVVIPLVTAVQTLALSAVATAGSFVMNIAGSATASILFSDTAAVIQTKIQAVSGLSAVTVTGSIASQSLVVSLKGLYGVQSAITFSSNTLTPATTVIITNTTVGQTMAAAITAAYGIVQFFGILSTHTVAEIGQTDLLAAAAVAQTLNVISFWVSYNQADIAVGGMLDLLRSGAFTQSRGLYYGSNASTTLAQVLAGVQYAGA